MGDIMYSVLMCNRSFMEFEQKIKEWLHEGTKVIWFGRKGEVEALKQIYPCFFEEHLLMAFEVAESAESMVITDGNVSGKKLKALKSLTNMVKGFNAEQYMIEHCASDQSLIVKAGAGTGKTTVMVDRVMFLLHTVEEISMSDIAMITFTNEATQNMRHKVQERLLTRFRLTGREKYIRWLERASEIRISTIHSFSRKLSGELGSALGYSTDLKLRSFKREKDQIIRDALNIMIRNKGHKRIKDTLGLNIHELEKLIGGFWSRLEEHGFSYEEIESLDWGEPESGSKSLHKTLSSVFPKVEERYERLKVDENSISMKDITRELRKILESDRERNLRMSPIRYMFVDEFQDSDNVQIKSIVWLEKEFGLNLFVVGDVKQSIYRFRGAVATAFDRLKSELGEQGSLEPLEFELTMNYRTSDHILELLDDVFRDWEEEGLLDYGNSLDAQNKEFGLFKCKPVASSEDKLRTETVGEIKKSLEECRARTRKQDKNTGFRSNVSVLTRTNTELKKLSEWCMEEQIPCYVKLRGGFFQSRAVREFLAMVGAYAFPDDPIYRFNYLVSPYGFKEIDLGKIERCSGDKEKLNQYFDELAKDTKWSENLKEFRLKPVMPTLRKIVEEAEPAKKFLATRKKELMEDCWIDEKSLEDQIHIEALQYASNLNKLMDMVREHFSGDFASLYNIYCYLLLNVQANREENESDLDGFSEEDYVCCMTVHGAKGLEFDTVIIPFTGKEYRKENTTEIIVDERFEPHRVGWSCCYNSEVKRNSYYEDCVRKEIADVEKEEARLLYVALTRAVRKLTCFVSRSRKNCWARLLEDHVNE